MVNPQNYILNWGFIASLAWDDTAISCQAKKE